MTLAQHYPPAIRLRLAAGEIALAASRLGRTITEPEQRHQLPGALAELNAAHEALLEMVQEVAPEAFHALAAGLHSTRDLPPPEIIDFCLEPKHA